jgi:hypothetical protein
MRDLKENHDIEFKSDGDDTYNSSQGILNCTYEKFLNIIYFFLADTQLIQFIVSVIDQAWYLIRKRYISEKTKIENTKTIIIPYPGRDDSLELVSNNLDHEYTVIVDSGTALANTFEYDYPYEWEGADLRSFNSLSSLTSIVTQTKFVSEVLYERLFDKQIQKQLILEIENERGISIENIVKFAISHALSNSIMEYKNVAIASYVFSEYESLERVVTGSNGSMYRPIRQLAVKRGLESYYIPHSIAHPMEVDHPPKAGTDMIVSGSFDKLYMESEFDESRLPTLVPLGRSYFRSEIIEKSRGISYQSDRWDVTIATQKIETMRDEFLLDLFDVFEYSDKEINITIKVHPAEKKSYYHELISDINHITLENITITNERLVYHLEKADIVFTMTSNVGLESMMLGTPSVSYNKLIPIIPSYPYATEGPGVLIESRSELRKFWKNLDVDQVDMLSTECERFAIKHYLPPDNCEHDIARYIES